MSMQIPNNRRLTDEERAFLLMRGEDARVKGQDERYPAEVDDEEDLDLDDEGDEDEGEDDESGDDYDNLTVAELNAEIEDRNAGGAGIKPAGTKKQNLIDALREHDAAE